MLCASTVATLRFIMGIGTELVVVWTAIDGTEMEDATRSCSGLGALDNPDASDGAQTPGEGALGCFDSNTLVPPPSLPLAARLKSLFPNPAVILPFPGEGCGWP